MGETVSLVSIFQEATQAYTILSNWLGYIRYLLWTHLLSQEVWPYYTELFKMDATLLPFARVKGLLAAGKMTKAVDCMGLLSPRLEAYFQPNSCKARKQVPARDLSMLLALLLLSKSVKSRVNPVCLRCLCSVRSPGPASVLKMDWVWQMENQQQSWDWLPNGTEEEVIWWGVGIELHEWRQWVGTLQGNSSIFHHQMNRLKVCKREKSATRQGTAFCHLPML